MESETTYEGSRQTVEDLGQLRWKIEFRAGDRLWHAVTAQGRDLYAVSDGTRPSDCENGPYIIDEDKLLAEGCLWLEQSTLDYSPLVGSFPLIQRKCDVEKHERNRVRCTLGVTMEIARRLGITEFGVRCAYKSGIQGEPGWFELKGRKTPNSLP